MPASRLPQLAMLILVLLPSALRADDWRRPKKLIATGWDQPDSRRLRENLAAMEKQPFSGTVVELTGRIDDKKGCPMRATFSSEAWQESWFANCVEDLRACRFTRLTDNFVVVGANPGNVDWFDDAGWTQVVEHWRIAAAVARQANFRGLLFDPEPYTEPYVQFSYNAQPRKADHPFQDYAAKARQRGREVMQAVAKEQPRIVLFCYFLNSVLAHVASQDQPQAGLAVEGYGLLPAFLDGLLDAAPPTVTFVDGCEGAYRHNSALQYLESAASIRGDCQSLVSPENRAKYRAQVQVSFGLYLDAYVNPPTSPWHIDSKLSTPSARLKENVRTALRVADEYVWVYGEKYRWWPTPSTGVKPEYWPAVLPACDRILGMAGDPVGYARGLLSGGGPNLARNGDFSAERVQDEKGQTAAWREGSTPAGWPAWQHEKSAGKFTWDREAGCGGKGAARAAGVANGCFLQGIPAQPGQTYVVAAHCRVQGRGQAKLSVQWQKADGKWDWSVPGKTFVPSAPPAEATLSRPATSPASGWSEIVGVVDVPDGVGRLVVLLGIGGQNSSKDVAWFDDVKIIEVVAGK